MKMKSAAAFIIILLVSSTAFAQFEWEKLAYYHSTGNTTPDIQSSYQIELHESGNSKLEYTKYGRTNIYEFTPSSSGLRRIDRMIQSSGVLDADTADLRGTGEFNPGPVYLLTIFLDKPTGYKKRKHPSVIIQTEVSKKYREKAFRIYEEMESLVPAEIWAKAYEDAEKNSGK